MFLSKATEKEEAVDATIRYFSFSFIFRQDPRCIWYTHIRFSRLPTATNFKKEKGYYSCCSGLTNSCAFPFPRASSNLYENAWETLSLLCISVASSRALLVWDRCPLAMSDVCHTLGTFFWAEHSSGSLINCGRTEICDLQWIISQLRYKRQRSIFVY